MDKCDELVNKFNVLLLKNDQKGSEDAAIELIENFKKYEFCIGVGDAIMRQSKPDISEALKYYKLGFKHGFNDCCSRIISIYVKNKDFDSVNYFLKKLRNIDSNLYYFLYVNANLDFNNFDKALEGLNSAIKENLNSVPNIYYSLYSYCKKKKDYLKCFNYLKTLVDQYGALSTPCFELATMYRDGIGTTKNDIKCFHYLTICKDYKKSLLELGTMYIEGSKNLNQDLETAYYLLNGARAAKNVLSFISLAYLYSNRSFSSYSFEKAKTWVDGFFKFAKALPQNKAYFFRIYNLMNNQIKGYVTKIAIEKNWIEPTIEA